MFRERLLFWIVIDFILVLAAVPIAGYGFLLVRGHRGWGGSSPNEQMIGTVADSSQRAMDRTCTGVVVTKQSTWLVGRREVRSSELGFSKQAPNLARMLGIPAAVGEGSSTTPRDFLSQPKSEMSFVSRLNPAGKFELVASVPKEACLRATPDGQRVFLLTKLATPENQGPKSGQTAVFQSDDQGQSWQWRKEGLFPDASIVATSLHVEFHDAQSFWAWGDLPGTSGRELQQGPAPSGLQYSSNGGRTVERVLMTEPMWASHETVKRQLGDNASLLEGGDGIELPHVLQLGPDRAVIWLSQSVGYTFGNEQSHQYWMTRYAPVDRVRGVWRIGTFTTVGGITVLEVVDNHEGHVVALLEHGDEIRVALLNPKTLAWDVQGVLPSAFGPLPVFANRAHAIHVGGGVIIVSIESSHMVPRWFYPWGSEAPYINGEAVFYSIDWGRSWNQLAITDSSNLLGLDPFKDQAIWASGKWYSSRDDSIRAYGLK